MTATVTGLLEDIVDVGRDNARGGYSRFVFTPVEHTLREWFQSEAARRSLDVEVDGNGVLWAWRHARHGTLDGAVVTGSHLDSVPGGGAYDGPLGVASGLAALDLLDARDATGRERALGIAVFPEEEGSRFGIACLGSRLLAGLITPERALGLRDADGTSFAEAMRAAGLDPRNVGPDLDRLAALSAFVELHVEQGRGLVDVGKPVAVGTSIIGHGRWRITVSGQGDHAGTTLMEDRRDPMVAAAGVVLEVRSAAAAVPGARATVGRLVPVPGGTNVIPSRVELWVDVRHQEDTVTAALVDEIRARADEISAAEGCAVSIVEESLSRTTSFSRDLSTQFASALDGAPMLATGAGHDAGVLAARMRTAMLYVRNPTGVSHSPEEHAEPADCEAGAVALADVLQGLLQAPRAAGPNS